MRNFEYNKFERDPIKVKFYASRAWKRVAYLVRVKAHYLCQRCHNRGTEVHHIKDIESNKLSNEKYLMEVALNENNLECLCVSCHNRERFSITQPELYFDENGMIQIKGDKNET